MMIQLQGLLSTITFLDVIDIVVVAYFLYRLFLMLKNTRAATLGKGLMVLIGFTLICRWLNLHVISWLLEKSMTVIMVALPVVFQPELRRALEQIGRGKLFHKGSELDEQELEEMLDSVAHATKVMSKNKVGALMVFERATGLAERIETGVPIDGLVSSGLLQNIFVKDTPLHDGAVIIRGNRVVAACCLLPLFVAHTLHVSFRLSAAFVIFARLAYVFLRHFLFLRDMYPAHSGCPLIAAKYGHIVCIKHYYWSFHLLHLRFFSRTGSTTLHHAWFLLFRLRQCILRQ